MAGTLAVAAVVAQTARTLRLTPFSIEWHQRNTPARPIDSSIIVDKTQQVKTIIIRTAGSLYFRIFYGLGLSLTAIGRRQLVASLRIADHVADREVIAAFLQNAATEVSPNPFPLTSVGAQSHIWAGQSFEFRSSQTASLGLACLLKALGLLSGNEPLAQEIFRSGPYRAYVYHPGDGCQIVGAVLHGRSGTALPVIECLPRSRTRRRSNPAPRQQLDLFALAQHG